MQQYLAGRFIHFVAPNLIQVVPVEPENTLQYIYISLINIKKKHETNVLDKYIKKWDKYL
jgi:hypothetical protein